MERVVTLHIEKLPEGVYLATSDDVQGLVAQGRTIQETVEIARDDQRHRRRQSDQQMHMVLSASSDDQWDVLLPRHSPQITARVRRIGDKVRTIFGAEDAMKQVRRQRVWHEASLMITALRRM